MKLIGLSLALLGLVLFVGCGGGSSSGGGGGVHISLTPSSAVAVPVTLTQQFTATVSGTSNTAVTWSLSGTACNGATCGTISGNGLYTAPATPPASNVIVKATLNADSTKSASVNVSVIHVTVTIAPNVATVALNGQQQFSATASPSNAPQTFNWTVSCTNAPCGSVDSTGLYTAPATLPSWKAHIGMYQVDCATAS